MLLVGNILCMNKIFKWLADAPVALFVCIFWFIGCLWNIFFDALVRISGIQLSSQYSFEAPQSIYDYTIVILVAPLIETALFQALPYHLLSKIHFLQKRLWLIIAISGLFFALQHFYSIVYIMFAFIPGILLVAGYHLRQGNHPFISIFAVHFSINATPLLYEFLFSGIK